MLACNESQEKREPTDKMSMAKAREALPGTWKTDPAENTRNGNREKSTMIISYNGQITYDLEQNGEIERFDLIYRISGDTLITAHLTDPTEERAIFRFENDHTLILESHGVRSVFLRVTK